MVFNSFEFLLFFPLVVILYYTITPRYRWMLLLAGSYYFYMSWKIEFVFLIVASTMVDYIAGLKIDASDRKRTRLAWLVMSLVINLGLLFTFKYLNFFNDNMRELLNIFGMSWNMPVMNLLLPVGISFYTFQTLSYTIEVYRRNFKAERHLGYFALYVAYFPQLVAGPIERPENLLPQLRQTFKFSYQNVTDGLKLMAWGFLKKLVVGDRIALFVDHVYNSPADFYGLNLLIPTMLFFIRVYFDFSAYSDIAIGAARIMGVNLSLNFNRPLYAVSFSSFWRRWHMTLTKWVIVYVYRSLITKVNHWGVSGRIIAIVLSFTIIGLWHGASWGMVLFGFANGVLVASEAFKWPWQRWMERWLRIRIKNFLNGIFVFVAISLTVVCFRANSTDDLITIYKNIFSAPLAPLTMKTFSHDVYNLIVLLVTGAFIFVVEFLQKDKTFLPDWINRFNPLFRWAFYLVILQAILNFGMFTTKEYIYFQF